MKASAKFFTTAIAAFVFAGSIAQSAFAARPDQKKGVCYVLTALHMSPKQFAKAYRAEKKENAKWMERSHRRMMQKQHGWNFFQYRAENHHEANPTHFQ